MKKTIVTLAILGGLATAGFSQGFVYFGAGAANATKVSTNSVIGCAAAGRTQGDNSYYYALFASSSQTTIGGSATAFSATNGTYAFNAGWTLVGIGAANQSTSGSAGTSGAVSQGTTSANQAALNGDGSLTVSGVAGGGNGNFVVVGWSANIGSTLAAMESWYANPTVLGWIGQSRIGVGQVIGDNGSNPTLNIFGSTANYVNGFTLGEVAAVPEPGTIALAALGGASLLMFRRKK